MKFTYFIITLLVLLSCSGSKPSQSPHTDLAHSYGGRAYTCFNSGDFACALVNYDKAFQQAGFSDEPLLQAGYLFNIGRVYFELGKIDSALQYFKSSQKEFTFYKDSCNNKAVVAFIALCYASQKRTDLVNEICKEKLFLSNRSEPLFYYTVRGRIELALGNITESKMWFDSAAVMLRKSDDYTAQALNCYYRGTIALKQKNYSAAATILDSSLSFMDSADERFRRWKVLLSIAVLNYCQNNSEAGDRYFHRAKECVPASIIFPDMDSLKGCAGF